MIVKQMVFESVNNYFLIFYIAFFKTGTLFGQENTCALAPNEAMNKDSKFCRYPDSAPVGYRGRLRLDENGVCMVPDCMYELQVQLLILFVLNNTIREVRPSSVLFVVYCVRCSG